MMNRLAIIVVAFCAALPALAQDQSLESYFVGRQVIAKVDMPGSEKGIDLRFDRPAPMDWNDTSSRIRMFGASIHKGDSARITKFVVKKDMIEFHLNGGGYGVAGDDTNIVVNPVLLPKSDREKDLEKQVNAEKDPHRRNDLQHDLDRERQQRNDLNARRTSEAQMASQMKAQQVAQRRLGGGSRFNLRWHDQIPSDLHNPDSVKLLLADYVDFSAGPGGAPGNAPPPSPPPSSAPEPGYAPPPPPGSGGPVQRGMKIDQVTSMLGRGKVMSDTTSPEGLHQQEILYASGDNLVDVTYVEGVVVRYSITSK